MHTVTYILENINVTTYLFYFLYYFLNAKFKM